MGRRGNANLIARLPRVGWQKNEGQKNLMTPTAVSIFLPSKPSPTANGASGLKNVWGSAWIRGGVRNAVEGVCSDTVPPRSGLNPCGKHTRLSMRRSMFRRGAARIRGGARKAVEGHAQTRLLHAPT